MGGAERQVLYLARYLKEEIGADVHYWGLQQPGLAMERCREWQIPCRLVPVAFGSRFGAFVPGVTRFVAQGRRFRPDLVLPYTNPANVLCGLAWRPIGAASCVWNQRDTGLQRTSPLIERLAARATPYFVANSKDGAAFLSDALGVRAGSVRVVPNGVPRPPKLRPRAEVRRAYDLPEASLVVCMVANLNAKKDHATLIRAWSEVQQKLAERGRAGILVLVGLDGGKRNELIRLTTDLGLSSADVRFAGQLSDPLELLSASDLCAHSTVHEGCPNAVLEAMSVGLPVVGTDVPGMPDTLGERGCEWLVELGDARALADRISKLLIDDELRRRVGDENRRRTETVFSLETMYATMTGLLASVAQEASIVPKARRGER
jgi:glycosyltransferase involved in cell wall biosynthesis